MPNNNETTTSFKVDISELKKAMQEAKRAVAVTNSEFKAVTSTMEDWTKSTDGISAKLKQLDSNLKSQKTILKSLEDQYELTVKEMGEGSKAADDLKIKINNQKAVINKTEREISKYEDSLTEVTQAEKIAAKTGKSVEEVLDAVGDAAKDSGDGFTILKGAVATFAGNALTSLVGGLRDAASNLLGLAESTREYREQMNKLESASAEAGYGVDFAKDKYKELYGVLGDETAANTTLSNFMAMGVEQGQLNGLINSAAGIWAKYGDSIPLDGLAESINETAKVGTVTGNLADALNWAGVSEDEFNESLAECTNEQARQKMIIAILNKNYGELGKSYKENNKSVIEARAAQADYTDTMAEMGERIEPVTTTLKEGFTGLLQEALKLVQGVDMEAFTAKIEEGFGVLKDEVLPAVKEGLGWILDNKDELIAGLAGIAAGFVAFKVVSLIQGLVTAFQAWKLATEGMTLAQAALNLVMSLNPIGIIITLIAGLVTAFVVLWNKSESFRNFWIGLWESIKAGFETAVQGIVTFFTQTIPNVFNGVIDFIKKNWQALLLLLINPFAGLFKYFYDNNSKFREFVDSAINFLKQLPSKAWTWLLSTINKVTQWRLNMISKAKEAAQGFLNKIIEFVRQLPTSIYTWLSNVTSKVAAWGVNLAAKGRAAAQQLFNAIINKIREIPERVKSIGSDIVRGLWNGINDMVGWIGGKISGFGDSVLSGLKNFFGIASPSKLMAKEIGRWLPEGIAVGIDKNAKSVLSSMKDLAADTVGTARAGLSTATTSLGSTGVTGGVVNNFNQVINSPKQLSRLDIYRQSKNLLGYVGGVL